MTQPTTKPAMAEAFAALKLPDFRKFFFAALVSNSGSWLQSVAMPYVMFQITDSGAWVGATVFALLAPIALIGPIAGPIADRVPRGTILIRTQISLCLIASLFAALWWTGVREPWAYMAASVLYGTANGFNLPAWQAYVSDLVPRESLMNAITLNSTQFNAARAIGPGIGGIVLATVGPGWSFAGNSISYLAVLGALLTLPSGQRREGIAGEGILAQFTAGLRYARSRPGIMIGYFVAGTVAFLGGTLAQVHFVLLAERVFNVGELRYGLLVSCFGIGSLLAAPWLATSATTIKRSTMLVAGLVMYGAAELVLVSTSIYWIGLIGVLGAGAAHLTMSTTTNTAIQLIVSEAMRGRIMGIYLMVFTMSMPIGALIQGPLAEQFGPRRVVLVMGLLLLSAAYWVHSSNHSQNLDVLPDH